MNVKIDHLLNAKNLALQPSTTFSIFMLGSPFARYILYNKWQIFGSSKPDKLKATSLDHTRIEKKLVKKQQFINVRRLLVEKIRE